ncbi:MAG TPA: dATP/dGTP diphosphohydrolase domain-containing protein [Dehalococcoidia bacterium]|nr:dATP/dGTP diphosphohydrolase domain-containing protein [Dehalococcoidia bacterium]
MIKKEEGEARQFSTGAHKQPAKDKGTPVLFPGDAYLEICKHFEEGAVLHGGRNWEKGIPLSELINSLERHIAQEKMGLTDESHDRALAWCAVVYLATKLRIRQGILPAELADIPSPAEAAGQQVRSSDGLRQPKRCAICNELFCPPVPSAIVCLGCGG